ncbi:MAG TPA: cyanophycin synthetase, partial [Candidatus Saccharimonadales bacterium]
GTLICDVSELKLLGQHNWQNACAAVTAVWQVTQDISAIRSVLTTFTGLEHRLEFVRELNGIKYYDDSFGTTPETAIVAIQSFEQPKIVILGGSDKGTSFDELAKAVKESNVRHVLLIGDTAPQIAKSLKDAGFDAAIPGGDVMEDIVQKAHDLAQEGDVVLLSTGCASFGLFKNYKDRGNQFQTVVNEL